MRYRVIGALAKGRSSQQKGKGYTSVARLGSFDPERADSRRVDGERDAVDGWPQEVRKLLFEAHQEASALRAERQALLARTADLESRLESARSEVAALTERVATLQARPPRRARPTPPPPEPPQHRPDQRWLSDVADRTATALRSGQETAQSLVERASQRAKELEEGALHEAAAIRSRADAQATRVLRLAHYDAEGVLQGAQASAEELLGEARKAAGELMAELHRRREVLLREIEGLDARRVSLLQACASIRRPVEEAIRALERGGEQQRPPARSPREALTSAITTARRVSGRAPGA